MALTSLALPTMGHRRALWKAHYTTCPALTVSLRPGGLPSCSGKATESYTIPRTPGSSEDGTKCPNPWGGRGRKNQEGKTASEAITSFSLHTIPGQADELLGIAGSPQPQTQQ